MKNVAIILEDMRIGGPQKQLSYFLKELLRAKTKNNCILFVPKNSKTNLSLFFNIKKIMIKELDIQYLSFFNLFNYIFFFFKDFFTIKNNLNNIEKIYIAGGTSNLKTLLIAIILRKKIYFHIHDTRSNIFIRLIIFILSKFIKKIFFASLASKKYYDFLSKTPKKVILRSSVDTEYFKKIKKKNKLFKIGLIANINPDKNLELFLRILENIKDKKIKFYLIGKIFKSQKKYYEEKLKMINFNKQKIIWYKNVNNPKKIMKKFDVLLCTSNYESLPLSIIEALSMSIPVISTNVGDVPYVLNKIKCGFIIKNDSKEFTKIINILKKDKSKLYRLAKNARVNIIKNFNIKDYKKKLENELFND
jgi:glycosyltransferase involved in cell wall biosynthesis